MGMGRRPRIWLLSGRGLRCHVPQPPARQPVERVIAHDLEQPGCETSRLATGIDPFTGHDQRFRGHVFCI